MSQGPPTPRAIGDVVEDLDALREQLSEVVNGNGHAGLRNLLDDIYGNDQRQRRGLIPRVAAVEKKVGDLCTMRQRDLALLKGVALGVGYVVADTTGLIALLGRLVGLVAN